MEYLEYLLATYRKITGPVHICWLGRRQEKSPGPESTRQNTHFRSRPEYISGS